MPEHGAAMTFEARLDPELAGPFARINELGLFVRDLEGLLAQRQLSGARYEALLGPLVPDPLIERLDASAPGSAGAPDVRIRVYRPVQADRVLPCLLWIHGGGMVIGSIDGDDRVCESYVREVGCAVASVGYRLAPENPYPAPIDDCYAALRWVVDHATELAIDPARIAVGGSSAGGGLAAGIALLSRDRGGPRVAFQLLVRPMLDDRNISPSSREFAMIPGWSGQLNVIGWTAFLGPARGSDEVPPYAAPSRATDLTRLPPTMLQVGELEVFRDEGIAYAARLLEAGVATELHVYPGAFHGWDGMVPNARVSKRSVAERMHALREAFAARA